MAFWEKRAFRWILAAGLLALDIGLSALAGLLYHGVYANWACSIPLLFAIGIALPLGKEKDTPTHVSPRVCLAVIAVASALAVALFALFRPAYTAEAACSLLEAEGWRDARLNPAYSAMTITGNQNPFVRAGYVLEATRSGESLRIFVNPENGEYHILND